MPNHDRERGAALIAVLLLMGTIGVLVASAVAVSQYATAETDTFAALQRSALEAESAANRTLCLLLSDRLRHADRRLGRRNDDRKERFLADGTEHIHMQGDGRISIRIFDAVAGLDLSGRAPIRQLSPRGTAKSEAREQVLARLEDYVDADDLVRNQSMEMPHYRAAGIPVLPRNRPLQFREEWLWIPGTAHIYPPSADGRLWTFRVIPPENMRPLAGRPNLLATPAAIIAEQCGLNEEECQQLRQALTLWREKQVPLEEHLSPGLTGKLNMHFSTRESGVYTILVNTASPEHPGRRLSLTVRPVVGDRYWEYYEFFYY